MTIRKFEEQLNIYIYIFSILSFFLIFSILFISISSVSAITVDNSTNNSLYTAISNSNETFFELNGTYKENTSITLNRNITIRSSGSEKAIIELHDPNSFFKIPGFHLTLENLIFKNMSNGKNALVYSYANNGKIEITNCSFTDFSSKSFRVVLTSKSNIVVIKDSVFESDSTSSFGAIGMSGGILEINNSNFTNCYIYGSPIATINNCIFDDYKYGDNIDIAAAAIHLSGSQNMNNISNSIFINNDIAIMMTNSHVLLDNCSFNYNSLAFRTRISTSDINITNSIFKNNDIVFHLNNTATLKAIGSTFINNNVTFNIITGSCDVSYSRFVNNTNILENDSEGSFIGDYNWWGSNVLHESVANVSKYFIVSFVNSSEFIFGENLTFNYLLRLNDSSTFDKDLLPEFFGEYYDSNGNTGSVLFSDSDYSFSPLMDHDNYDLIFVMDNEVINFEHVFVADYSELEGLVDSIRNVIHLLESSDYSVESWNNLSESIRSARSMIGNDTADTQAKLDAQILALQNAFGSLTFNYAVLEDSIGDAITNTTGLDKSLYTADSWNLLQKALTDAQSMLNSRNATNYDNIDSLVVALDYAVRKLAMKNGVVLSLITPTINKGQVTNIAVTLKSTDGKLLGNQKVQITINGKTLTGSTNAKGVANFYVKNLKVGKFAVNAKYSGDGNYKSAVKSGSQVVKGIADLVINKVKRSGNSYKITVKNSGSVKSGITKLKLWFKKGKKTYSKIVKVKSIGVGKSLTVSVKFFKYSTHKKLVKYVQVNYNKAVKESNYKNDLKKFKV